MDSQYIMAIDQGTTGTRVILFNADGKIHSMAYREIEQIYPNPGWVEHNPVEYWETTMECAEEAMEEGEVSPGDIQAIGITNQRETTILWDGKTGEPVCNAIVWQCRRSADICDQLKADGYEEVVREKTGLVIDAYFSGTKIQWILDHVDGVRKKIDDDRILMGTIDTWLIWHLSGGRAHVSDYSNASRTMLLNIHDLDWDRELLEMVNVPEKIMPEPRPNSGVMAHTDPEVFFGEEIPIAGAAGDQQAATFGQTCFETGMAKNSYGTALATMMNIGDEPTRSEHGLLTDLAWVIDGTVDYAYEGVNFTGGAAITWLRDGIGIIEDAEEASRLATNVEDTGGVYLVPAFTGLAAPYWDQYARGAMVGITRGTSDEHVARAALESMAYQTRDVLDAMAEDSGQQIKALRADGGATESNFLMQFQADILDVPVEKPAVTEMAALGAAYLAGLGVGFWNSQDELAENWEIEQVYEPQMDDTRREKLYTGWQKAIERSKDWAEPG